VIGDPHETIMRVTRLMQEVIQIDVDDIDTDLIETGLIDSLALVDLIFRLEQEFGVSIRLDAFSIDSFRTVRGVAGLLLALEPDIPRTS
jgi:acyl carrier protein